MPMFKVGKDQGIKEVAGEVGNKVGDILYKNSINSGRAIDVVEGWAKKDAVLYSEEIIRTLGAKGSEELIEEGTKEGLLETSKLIPIFGQVISGTISGILNAVGTKSIGEKAQKYFIDDLNKNYGCDYIIDLRDDFKSIFNYIDELSKENYGKITINEIN